MLILFLGGMPTGLAAAIQTPAKPIEAEPESLVAGLVATYRSQVDSAASLTRVDSKPGFALGHSAPHPRIPPGPFEVVWRGLLHLREPGPIRFDAWVCGELWFEIDGQMVLRGSGEHERSALQSDAVFERPSGLYRVAIRYRSPPGKPARLQIWWQGKSFEREPLPPWQLKHLAADRSDELVRDEIAGRGREHVERYGCARCHPGAFPSAGAVMPGPSLADVRGRVSREWLMAWLADPARVRRDAHMPALFAPDRSGFVERSILADHLLGKSTLQPQAGAEPAAGDHRLGRRRFIDLGCAACHVLPESNEPDPSGLERTRLSGFHGRLPAGALSEFLMNPHARYPDARMPRIPLTPSAARDIAEYLLLWSRPPEPSDAEPPPTAAELDDVAKRLNVRRAGELADALVRDKRCTDCHVGLGPRTQIDQRIDPHGSLGCLGTAAAKPRPGSTLMPRFTLTAHVRSEIQAYFALAAQEIHPSPFDQRRRLVAHLGCARCHARDSDRAPPIEVAGSSLGGSNLETIPFQRTPRLHFVHQKYSIEYLRTAVREGVRATRAPRYSYRMPSFGLHADAVIQGMAEMDGDLVGDDSERGAAGVSIGNAQRPQIEPDPTLGPMNGPVLVGFQGYSCVSCHVWNGQLLSDPDPGAVGPDLTMLAGRIRRAWFDRFLENPLRLHPGTPMPSPFPRGQRAPLRAVLDGDPMRQRDALWAYLSLGAAAPSPKPAPPLSVTSPEKSEPAVIAQIPLRVAGRAAIESICVLSADHDLLVYDLAVAAVRHVFVAAHIQRTAQGRLRTYSAAGTPVGSDWSMDPSMQWADRGKDDVVLPVERAFDGYERLADGVRVRWRTSLGERSVVLHETVRIVRAGDSRAVVRRWEAAALPPHAELVLHTRAPGTVLEDGATVGKAQAQQREGVTTVRLTGDAAGRAVVQLAATLPAASDAMVPRWTTLSDSGLVDGSLDRPGYRAIPYPRPKTSSGEDLIMPVAVAADPRDGRLFVASTKLGEIFVLEDPTDDGRAAKFRDYARGLFQEAYSMLAEPGALYVLHRRNLTRIMDGDGDGVADRFDRVYGVPHGVADTYDYGYGLVRDGSGAFVFTLAPHSNQHLPGAGNAVRLPVQAVAKDSNDRSRPGATLDRERIEPSGPPEVICYGFRNPLGWCVGPEGEVFFSDNQGEWVATNKLCHLVPGRYYGYPNPQQREHAAKPPGRAAVWVPYDWAHSINGITYDATGGKFGPYAGQFFLSELMFGGAIIRAQVERVNGQYQGACFPFWGKGLLGPVSLTFDPRGRLWVGSITEPGWMAQPDRGAVFRIDFSGSVPFEMQSIHARPDGFRVRYTKAVDRVAAADPAAYKIEHYRYEYTGAYGSPELDRTAVKVERVDVSQDGLSVELTVAGLVAERVYMITSGGVVSASGEPLVHSIAAYTLNELPEHAAR